MLGSRWFSHAPVTRSASTHTRPLAKPGHSDSSAATAFAMLVLVLGISLALWAPWRARDSTLISAYTPRAEGTVPAVTIQPVLTGDPAPTASATVVVVAAAATAAPVADDASRPSGLPLRRPDWVVLRDYAAHGGPGPNGAIDIAVEQNREAVGTPIYATHDGTVKVLRNNRRYGNLVAVKNNRWSTTYGHLEQVLVNDGQQVRRGDQLGTMGATGIATSPHLDYQVWEKVNNVETNRNPQDFLEAP